MQKHTRAVAIFAVLATFCVVSAAQAKITPNALFSDHAVLQNGAKIPVWGTTDSNDKVSVTLAGQTVSAMPADGKWRIDLPEQKSGGPHELLIEQGSEKLTIKDVLVGEVWLCGGQSNMEMAVQSVEGAAEAISAADNPKIRLFTVPRHVAAAPESEVKGSWQICSPQTVPGFSAVGYFFGRDLQKALGAPIGLINSNVGGTPIERWMSAEAMSAILGEKIAKAPHNCELYNAMIAPLAPDAIRGAIWYQGEANAGQAYAYRKLLPALIQDWRAAFHNPQMPFLIVQLAPYGKPDPQVRESPWAELREAQLLTSQTVPNTGLAVITDLGEEGIHPRRKTEVGTRLARIARAKTYGEKLEYSGPIYEKMQTSGDKIILHFQHADGLAAKGDKLTGFTIADKSQTFHPANAQIEGDTVVVQSPEVSEPVAVRYGWSMRPELNLANREGLPATPFRTDEFQISTQGK